MNKMKNTYQKKSKFFKHDNIERVVREAGDIINDVIHTEIARNSSIDVLTMDRLNIDEQIENINSLLWSFVVSVTRTATQRKSESKETNLHVKKLRRYFIICLLEYCTNSQRPTLLHTLLSDTVEVCGGSRKLIKILNHFGVVSSTDTHDRFMTQVATDQRSKSVWDYLPKSTLTLASADNFDMLQSHARVYHGDQSRSFHAVTVQITQPNPKECLMESCAPSTKRTLVSSPSNSPHKLGKIGPKRHRTLTPRNLCEQIQAAKINQVPKNNRDSNYPTRQPVSLIIDNFFEEPIEKSQRKSLEFKLLAYCFIKEQLLNQPNKLLQEFKDLYAYSTQGSTCKSNNYILHGTY